MAKGLLALDLARRAGWAVAAPSAIARWPRTVIEARVCREPLDVWYGTHVVAPEGFSDGAFYHRLHDWVADMITIHDPAFIVYEAANPAGFKSPEAAYRLLGMSAICELVCSVREVELRALHVQSIKKTWTGNGRAKKPEMVAEARARGFAPKDDNAADAIAMLDHAIAVLRPRFEAIAVQRVASDEQRVEF